MDVTFAVRKKIYNPFFFKILAVLVFFLSGGDVIAIKFGDSSIRLVFLLLPILFFIVFYDIKLYLNYCILILVLVGFFIPSIYYSYVPLKSLFTIIWIFLTVLLYNFTVPALVAKATINLSLSERLQSVNKMIILSYRFQLLIGLVLFFLGFHERIRAFYYEPSYFSLSLSIYVSILMFEYSKQGRKYYFDYLLLLSFFVFSFSANFILVCFLLFCMYFVRFNIKSLLLIIFVSLLFSIYILYIDDINTSIIRAFWNGEIDAYQLLLRGGNRLSRFLSAIDVFKEHYVFGVGLSGYESFTNANGVVDYSQGYEHLEAKGVPVINMYLEVLATTGISGGGAFFLLVVFMLVICVKNIDDPFSKATITMLVLLNFESNFLRPYFWLCWALAYLGYKLKNKKKWVY